MKIGRFIINLPRHVKQALTAVHDVLLVPVALLGAYTLQLNNLPPTQSLVDRWQAVPLLMLISGLLCLALGIHRVQLKAYETRAIRRSALHAAVVAGAAAVIDNMAGTMMPLSTFITFGLLYFLLAVGSRFVLLQVLLAIYRRNHEQIRVIIYGAGRTGQQLAAALSTDERIQPVAFVDDAKALQSTIIRGLSVYSPLTIPALIRDKGAHRVLLAMPSVPRGRIAQISRRLEDMGLDVQALPSFAQLAGSPDHLVEQLRPITPSRFLGRAPLDAELPGGSETYVGRRVLVSGAGGSIGSELCRQLIRCRPERLVLVEFSELALYQITMEMEPLAEKTGVNLVPVLGSAGEGALMRRVLGDNRVEIILHAAAYKHVPIVEQNPIPGFANNVLATHALAQAALECGVERFILISSDKAVRPRNMMGASKRLAELVVQDLAQRARTGGGQGTIFSMVRFGNVLGSSGSVIPRFQEQIAKGGPVTVTHRAVTRYFMTIPEAARLVLVAGTFAEGGEVFVLDMGDPIVIYDLARQMIEAAGHRVRDEANPDGDIAIRITGLRPGEKLHEELLIGQGQLRTPHPKILLARETCLSEIEVAAALKALRAAVGEADPDALRGIVARFVEGGEAIVSRPASAPALLS